MNRKDLMITLSDVNADYILDSEPERMRDKYAAKRRKLLFRYGALAASFLIVIISVVAVLMIREGPDVPTPSPNSNIVISDISDEIEEAILNDNSPYGGMAMSANQKKKTFSRLTGKYEFGYTHHIVEAGENTDYYTCAYVSSELEDVLSTIRYPIHVWYGSITWLGKSGYMYKYYIGVKEGIIDPSEHVIKWYSIPKNMTIPDSIDGYNLILAAESRMLKFTDISTGEEHIVECLSEYNAIYRDTYGDAEFVDAWISLVRDRELYLTFVPTEYSFDSGIMLPNVNFDILYSNAFDIEAFDGEYYVNLRDDDPLFEGVYRLDYENFVGGIDLRTKFAYKEIKNENSTEYWFTISDITVILKEKNLSGIYPANNSDCLNGYVSSLAQNEKFFVDSRLSIDGAREHTEQGYEWYRVRRNSETREYYICGYIDPDVISILRSLSASNDIVGLYTDMMLGKYGLMRDYLYALRSGFIDMNDHSIAWYRVPNDMSVPDVMNDKELLIVFSSVRADRHSYNKDTIETFELLLEEVSFYSDTLSDGQIENSERTKDNLLKMFSASLGIYSFPDINDIGYGVLSLYEFAAVYINRGFELIYTDNMYVDIGSSAIFGDYDLRDKFEYLEIKEKDGPHYYFAWTDIYIILKSE